MPLEKKRGAGYERADLPLSKVYLEDIEALVDVLSSVADKVDIETDRYTLSTPADLLQLPEGGRIELTLSTIDPYYRVRIAGGNAFFEGSGGTGVQLRGAKAEVLAVFKSRQRWGASVVMHPMRWAWASLLWVLGFVGLFALLHAHKSLSLLQVGVAALSIGMAVYTETRILSFLWRGRVIVVPRRRAEAPSFWKRNGEKVVVNLIVAVVASVMTTFGAYLIARATGKLKQIDSRSRAAGLAPAGQPCSTQLTSPLPSATNAARRSAASRCRLGRTAA
jgi:hypothetical protein